MKPTRRKTSTPARRKAAFRLPTVATFAKLSLTKRTTIFARWLARQPKAKPYSYWDSTHCVLGQFARALWRDKTAQGGARTIHGPTDANSKPITIQAFNDPEGIPTDALYYNTTFGAASLAFNAALRA